MKRTVRQNPPGWTIWFFRLVCNEHLSDAVLGDLLELYDRRRKIYSKRKADFLFVWNVIQFIQPFAWRKKSKSQDDNRIIMLRSYFTIAWRSMSRQKMYSSIKVGGFALGLATCMVIALFIRHELSYDKHYQNGDRIFRVYNDFAGPKGGKGTAFPAPIGHILRTEFPEVEKAGRLIPYDWFNAGSNLFRPEDQLENTYEEGFAYMDQDLLEILEIPMVYGNALHALDKPNTLVISRAKAEKYFPGQDPVGKTIVLNDDRSRPLTIGGVMENLPATSHLKFEFFITLTGEEFWDGEQTNWCCWNYNPYVRLRADADAALFEEKLLAIRDNHLVRYLKEIGDANLEEVKKNYRTRIQPVGDIYLRSQGISDIIPHGDARYTWLFGGIACFILMLACVNFINLSTAKSANRAKEVGLRKVVGSLRAYIVRQFLTESTLYSLVSFVLAVALVWLFLPNFNLLAGKSLEVPWREWWMFPLLIVSALVIGVIAGAYPSFYLSSFKPIDVLKGSLGRGTKGSRLRSVMVVFQFTTSIVLVIGTFIIYRQMKFILTTKVGFDKEQVIMIQGTNTLGDRAGAFKEEILQVPGVRHVAFSDYLPVGGTKRDQNGFYKEGKSQVDKAVGAQRWQVDRDYIKTMGMKLVEGRDFIYDLASDSQAIIVNQAMVRQLELKPPVVGQRIQNWLVYTIIGVVEDFHFESMKGPIEPLCMVAGGRGEVAATKLNTTDVRGTIDGISDVWKKFMPNQPIRYSFLDESYARMYDDVRRTGRIFFAFASLAIVVACLGLFALSAYLVEQRQKEVSIRLVLGASIRNIFRLLTQNFLALVLISFAIASPVAWYMMTSWLEDYEYKTEITWDVFVLSGIASVAIALLTVSYQSLRAALANPATALRSE